MGAKGSGKTTLSLALAARGHGFLGDEVAAVDSKAWEVIPLRRAVSVRQGPASRPVAERLGELKPALEPFPDGSTRVRAHVRDLFPRSQADPAPLRCIFFLGKPGPRAGLREIAPRASDLARLTPLAGTLWRRESGYHLSKLLQLVSRSRCFTLDPGDPDETEALIERAVEGS